MENRAVIIEDEKLVSWSLSRFLEKQGFSVTVFETGEPGVQYALEYKPDIIFIDYRLPDQSGIDILMALQTLRDSSRFFFMTAYGSEDVENKAFDLGVMKFFHKPLDFDKLQGDIDKLLEEKGISASINNITEQDSRELRIGDYITVSPEMHRIFHTVQKLVMVDSGTILLLGETGTGKDTIARIIHEHSPRKYKPFVIVNCASLQETLLESELFGYEKGAFTDAKARKSGQLEMADGGTVVLDEIGEIPISFQAKLLRFIETQTFYRIGGTQEQKVNVRIIASTNRDLREEMEQGNFREDLFFRLNVITLTLPPLRERLEDIPLLLNHFIKLFNNKYEMHVLRYSEDTLKMLTKYAWPGNIRELKYALERVFLLENPTQIEAWHFPREIRDVTDSGLIEAPCDCFAVSKDDFFQGRSFDEMEKMIIQWALEKEKGNQSRAASRLDITREKIRYKMKKYNIH